MIFTLDTDRELVISELDEQQALENADEVIRELRIGAAMLSGAIAELKARALCDTPDAL